MRRVVAEFASSALFPKTLQQTLQSVGNNALGIQAGSAEIRSSADDLARRTEQQAASVEQTAAALDEITASVKDSTVRAEEAGQLVAKARSGAQGMAALPQPRPMTVGTNSDEGHLFARPCCKIRQSQSWENASAQ